MQNSCSPQDSNRLLDPNSNSEIANYPIYKILFCVRGHDGTPESDCFAFTESHHNAEIFRIHVFRCQIREAVSTQSHLCNCDFIIFFLGGPLPETLFREKRESELQESGFKQIWWLPSKN